VLALLVGAPCTLLAARAGTGPFDNADAFVMRHLARPGRVRLTPDAMEIAMNVGDADHDLRRSALDRDPGFVPWLHRSVRFAFDEHAQGGKTV
jgi:hypothetical protein